jgi:hypothetical protein
MSPRPYPSCQPTGRAGHRRAGPYSATAGAPDPLAPRGESRTVHRGIREILANFDSDDLGQAGRLSWSPGRGTRGCPA